MLTDTMKQQSKAALKRAVREAGGPVAMARKCNAVRVELTTEEMARARDLTYQAVQRWIKQGLPGDRVLEVERAVDKCVTRHELRPDLYPLEVDAA